jgi:hypothetical protein
MSFHDVKFSRTVDVEREVGVSGTDFVFSIAKLAFGTAFDVVVLKLSETQLMEAVMGIVDENGLNVETDLPHEVIMDAYAGMPAFSSGTQALKHS